MTYMAEHEYMRRQTDNLLNSWEYKTRSQALSDFNYMQLFFNTQPKIQAAMLRKIERRLGFWPTDGYIQS